MKISLFRRPARFSLACCILLASCFALSVNAQPAGGEIEVPIIQKFGGRDFGCRAAATGNAVIDEETFNRIISEKDCAPLGKLFNVNFDDESLITFTTSNECLVRAAARVTRNDQIKKYTIRIRSISGDCSAAGGRSYQGWLVIEKIRPNYKVEFSETKAAQSGVSEKKDFSAPAGSQTKTFAAALGLLKTRPVNLKGCIQTFRKTQHVIRDRETFLKTIRADAGRNWCLENLETIDFEQHSLLGIAIDSGYCGVPSGLKYQVIKDAEKKRYLLHISYIDPGRAICRALRLYDLWLLVPRVPPDYEVEFEVSAKRIAER
jgi:hypothetical protein